LAGTGASLLATITRFLEERHEPGPVNIFAAAVFPEVQGFEVQGFGDQGFGEACVAAEDRVSEDVKASAAEASGRIEAGEILVDRGIRETDRACDFQGPAGAV
jgi:hypothetical protein